MRFLPAAALVAALAASMPVPVAPTAQAADLASPYARHRIRRPPVPRELPDRPVLSLYTRPVVGFYGYPFDYAVPVKRYPRASGASVEPYILRRDAPHGVQVVE